MKTNISTDIPQMLTINRAAKAVNLSPYFIRQLVLQKNKNIKFIKAGRKYLINFDSLIKFLNTGEVESVAQNDTSNKIKKVEA